MNVRIALTAVVACVLSAQAAASQSSQSTANAALRTQISAAWQKFATDLKAGDSTSATGIFAADIVQAYNTEFRGIEAVRTEWSRLLRTYVWEDAKYTNEDFAVAGDLAFDFGVGNQRFHRTAGGDPTTQRFRYAAIWKRQADGAWKLFRMTVTMAALPK